MHSSDISADNRVIFFDNLRVFVVLCVVLQHASNAYTHLAWWPVSDSASSMFVGWLRSFIDAFAMPLLFYIAGYFAIPTIKKKGVAAFLRGKLNRLGILTFKKQWIERGTFPGHFRTWFISLHIIFLLLSFNGSL